MHFANSLTALTILGVVAHVQAKAVFAHFMVGNNSLLIHGKKMLIPSRLGLRLVMASPIGPMISAKQKLSASMVLL